MSEWVRLTAQDGQALQAYVARPAGEAIGALVVVQEIFGVNAHIRNVCDGYAAEGFLVVAPALFDRIEPGVQLTYSAEDKQKAMALRGNLQPEASLLDVAAAYAWAMQEKGSVGVVGFCYGGLMAWLSATRGEAVGMQPACCVGYYAGGIGKVAQEEPACPVMLHFGAADSGIGPEQADAVRQAHPELEVFVYEGAGHAFNRDVDPSTYNAEAARLARERTLRFLKTHLA